MNFILTVNDAGELKPISATEIAEADPDLAAALDTLLNTILDKRALADAEKETTS